MQKKITHGGARPGAGRKGPVTKKGISFSLSVEVVTKVRGEKMPSALAEKLFREHYKIDTEGIKKDINIK